MADKELLLAISDMLDQKLQPIKDDLETVKKDVKHLKKEMIKAQAMDEAILDEVERVHEILNQHKADKSAHTA